MQKDLFCTPIVSLLQCKKGFFAHLKLYFGSEKKPFGNMNGACDAAKTIKTDSQILLNWISFCNSFLLRVQYLLITLPLLRREGII